MQSILDKFFLKELIMKIYRILIWNKNKSFKGKYDFIDLNQARFNYNKILYENDNWGYLALIQTDLFGSMLDTFDLIERAKNMGVVQCR